ncbi:MAG TPA: glycoside hydrolase family 97 protein [Prolixibacteraceae bacterium]|nr:glycoside hydrolase family 97 protein [Prolixibacteraceae bacterium]
MKNLLFTLFLLWALAATSSPKDTLTVHSPNGIIGVKIWMNNQLNYQIFYNKKAISGNSVIDLIPLKGNALSTKNVITASKVEQVNMPIVVPVPDRRKQMNDHYNQMTLSFRQPYQVTFRVYDEGVAYRLTTLFKDSLYIKNEVARFSFVNNPEVYFPLLHKKSNADVYHTSFEELYPLLVMNTLSDTTMAYSPVLVVPKQNPKIAISESDLRDYPGMFLKGTGSEALQGAFAPYPLEEKSTKELYSQKIVVKRADYIARTAGKRNFPWRVWIIAAQDKDLPVNDLIYKLAEPSKLTDVSWIHPGKCTDEWIINVNLFNVPFRSGINTATYKYYIDFAKQFGFERIMMDAGWSDNNNLFKIVPEINMDTLAAYAKKQNIKLSMWTLGETLDRQLEDALVQFNKWGVDFIMTDFIDRDDQKTVNFYERVAKACADHHIMIMYHGAYAPKGFNRTYPNAVTREGVLGSEYNVWSEKVTPHHDLTIPFTRMLAGSLDYEPGFLNNATQVGFRNIEGNPMSYGTRCHQLAMFVVYDSPIQIFSGNPSQGTLQPDFMNLMGSIPAGWDETIVPDAKVGEYIITARKKSNDWFVGGMTDWTARDFKLNLDFLDDGTYRATLCKDGINADKYAADYSLSSFEVNRQTIVPIHFAPGGGFVLKLEKK